MLEWKEEIDKEVPSDDSATEDEKLLLYTLIRSLKPHIVLETGTHRGLATLYMAHALYDNGDGKIYTADPTDWGAKGNFRKFSELEKIITRLDERGDQIELDEKIDFWFCDGLHEREEVISEWHNISPHLSDKAVVVFHDAGGDNVAVGVHGALLEIGIKAESVLLPTHNRLLIWSKFTLPYDGLPKNNMLTSYMDKG